MEALLEASTMAFSMTGMARRIFQEAGGSCSRIDDHTTVAVVHNHVGQNRAQVKIRRTDTLAGKTISLHPGLADACSRSKRASADPVVFMA